MSISTKKAAIRKIKEQYGVPVKLGMTVRTPWPKNKYFGFEFVIVNAEEDKLVTAIKFPYFSDRSFRFHPVDLEYKTLFGWRRPKGGMEFDIYTVTFTDDN